MIMPPCFHLLSSIFPSQKTLWSTAAFNSISNRSWHRLQWCTALWIVKWAECFWTGYRWKLRKEKVAAIDCSAKLGQRTEDTYVMKIKVEDGGTPQSPAHTAILQVTVSDVNDSKPVFKEGQVEVHIPERMLVGTSVIQLSHWCRYDSNAEIRYIFGAQVAPATKRLFALNNTTGLITVQRSLDREETAIHKVTVLASDGSSTPARATVTINVTDVNDNPPNIDLRYIISPINGTVYLSEKDPVNTKLPNYSFR